MSVSHCCKANHPKTQRLKAATVLLSLPVLGLDRAPLWVLLRLWSSGGVTGRGRQDARSHASWAELAVAGESNEGGGPEATCGLSMWLGILSARQLDVQCLRAFQEVESGNSQLFTSRPGLDRVPLPPHLFRREVTGPAQVKGRGKRRPLMGRI